jgi:hypothetical protein
MLLNKDILGWSIFNKDSEKLGANKFEGSDIQKWL